MSSRAVMLCFASAIQSEPGLAQAPSAGAQVGYDNGFYVRSPDGANELEIKGLFQFGANVYDSARTPSTEFDVKRMRLEFSAKVDDALLARVEPNFLPDETEVEEAWIGFDILDHDARLMFGRMKAPFNLEEVLSRRHIDFARFSILNQFAPAEDHGVFLNGTTRSNAWDYGLAVYNGTGGSDTNSGKDVALRTAWHPFAGDEASALHNLQVGLAATFGEQDEDVGDSTVDNETGLSVIQLAPGTKLSGSRRRVGFEGAWFFASWFVQTEVMHIAQDMSLGAEDDEITYRGAYIDVSKALTGEDKTFDGVFPRRPFDFKTQEGGGAWVLALRFSELRSDDALEDLGFAVPGTFTEYIRTASIGVNWIANRHLTLRNAFVHTEYSDEVALDDGSRDRENALLVELQLSF